MRCSLIVAGTLLSVAGAFTQQPGPPVAPDVTTPNIVPQEAMNGAIFRALAQPRVMAPLTMTPTVFRIPPPQVNLLQPKVCAAPLLEAHGVATNDRITRPAKKEIDGKMVASPTVPVCGKP